MRIPLLARPLLVACAPLLLSGCFHLFGGGGGGKADFKPPRRVDPLDVAVPEGYRIEVVATGLTYPTGVAFDGEGTPYVTESGYSYGEDFASGRLLRVEKDGRLTEVAKGEHQPWTGVTWHQGAFYVAQGGEQGGGRIVRVTPDGLMTPLVSSLPGLGDHHTNGPAVGPDGALYFGVGTATNSGVVGPDNASMGWLKRNPAFHDVPCRDVTLAGVNYPSANPLASQSSQVLTGAFVPFGTETKPGEVIKGGMPCSGAVFRLASGSTTPELVAWGFRNPFGLAFAPNGRLYVTENGYDVRGSRPLFGVADWMWEVEPGGWYGFPDFAGGKPVDQEWFKVPGGEVPKRVLQEPPGTPPQPVAAFGVHSSSNRFDFSRNPDFGHVGEAFVAQFGDQAPDTGETIAPVGFKVVRVDVSNGVIEDFVANKDKGSGGPASRLRKAGLERPIDARFDPSGRALYIVDFGVMLVKGKGDIRPFQQTGVLWRVTRATPEAKP
ncbi:sorbosone dehydrogenase family protein [Myxococcus sp. AB036A]|uniref:PQQ-dependent sugar dehydrogenase n=1 Tax=Myxococcus sp. AB036A TaxID=2562793 RepID=UPI001146ED76|nr:PQQ-dependent sugar dehydrogenase [Myxococcus sp. AB036A]